MKKLHIHIWIIILSLGFAMGSCSADHFFKKANHEYKYMNYAKSIKHYQKGIAKRRDVQEVENLANAYFYTNQPQKAKALYEEVIESGKGSDKANLYYGRVLMSEGEYKKAIQNFEKYLDKHPGDVVAGMLLSSSKSINQRYRDTTLYELTPIKTEDFTAAFSAVEYGDGIVFSAEKDVFRNAKKNAWTGNSYLDLYYMEKDDEGNWISPVLLEGKLNGRFHEGPATFNAEGDEVYFTRSNYFKRKMEVNEEEENNLKIFKATLVDDKWTNLEELPFNSDDYSCGHPTLSADGKILYFVSDMPGGEGGTDLYKSVYENGSWSEPENLGEEVNTTGNEMFPYIHKDGTLYFSSNAHNSMGGLDVFLTYNYEGRWMKPENLNYPLNSSSDDFSFVLSEDNETGFVSSSRAKKDELYKFKKNDPRFVLFGRARKKDSFEPVAGVTVEITRQSDDKVITMTSDKDGKFEYKLSPDEEYHLLCTKEGCFTRTDRISTRGLKYSENFYADFLVEEIELDKPIVLENIYYDFDKWHIREDAAKELNKLVKLLKDNPNIHIEMGSHTDARGTDKYNMILSDKRALAAVRYLIYKGIDADRLTWKGYGESVPIHKCGLKCSEEEHQENRRTEFKVTKK